MEETRTDPTKSLIDLLVCFDTGNTFMAKQHFENIIHEIKINGAYPSLKEALSRVQPICHR